MFDAISFLFFQQSYCFFVCRVYFLLFSFLPKLLFFACIFYLYIGLEPRGWWDKWAYLNAKLHEYNLTSCHFSVVYQVSTVLIGPPAEDKIQKLNLRPKLMHREEMHKYIFEMVYGSQRGIVDINSLDITPWTHMVGTNHRPLNRPIKWPNANLLKCKQLYKNSVQFKLSSRCPKKEKSGNES